MIGANIYLLLFIAGIITTEYQLSKIEQQWGTHKSVYIGQLIDTPKEKEHSTFCSIKLLGQIESGKTRPINKKVVLYLTHDSLNSQLKRGDKLLFYGQVKKPHNNGNPEEFDYSAFLTHQGISGTAFINNDQWQVIGYDSTRTLQQITLDYRSKLLEKIKTLGFTGDEYTVLSALVLGYQDELSQEIKESYSISGVSHVLSLSGLHIGFLYLLLNFLLAFANKQKVALISKQLIIICILWAFAFLTGLLSPVVRSVIMFSLIALSKMRNNQPVTLNTLAIAAFFMLLYNPFYLYDVSFQLSFTAVAGIVIIQPMLHRQIKTTNKISSYIWSLSSVSIAAQLITAPIVIYYFSRFSTHFLLSNILVIPLVSIIMYIAVITLSIGFIPPLQSLLACLLQFSIKTLNGTVTFVEHLPYSSINQLYINQIDIILLYVILFSGILFLLKKRKALFILLPCLLFFFILRTQRSYQLQHIKCIVFYNVRNCPTVHLIESKQRSYLFSAQPKNVIDKLHYATNRYWNKLQLEKPQIIPCNYKTQNLWRHNNIASFEGKTICMINDSIWKNKCSNNPLNIDYLYLCKGYKGKILWLMPLFNVHQVIIDSSISEYRKEKLKNECTLLGLNFVSLSEKGAYQIPL